MRERIVRAVAGTIVLVSIVLACYISLHGFGWLFLLVSTCYSLPLQSFVLWKRYWMRQALRKRSMNKQPFTALSLLYQV